MDQVIDASNKPYPVDSDPAKPDTSAKATSRQSKSTQAKPSVPVRSRHESEASAATYYSARSELSSSE